MRHRWAVKRMPVLGRLGRASLDRTLRRAKLASFGASLWVPLLVFILFWYNVTFMGISAGLYLSPVVDHAVPEEWWEEPVFIAAVVSSIAVVYLAVGLWLPFWLAKLMGHERMLKRIKRWIREGSCVACGYNLGGIDDSERCPECGAANLAAPQGG